jgi:hypothetical protein
MLSQITRRIQKNLQLRLTSSIAKPNGGTQYVFIFFCHLLILQFVGNGIQNCSGYMWRWRLTDVAVWSTISVETTTTARY